MWEQSRNDPHLPQLANAPKNYMSVVLDPGESVSHQILN